MEIVKFRDGEYAIRRGNKYRDREEDYWWRLKNIDYCKGSFKKIHKLHENLVNPDIGEVVSVCGFDNKKNSKWWKFGLDKFVEKEEYNKLDEVCFYMNEDIKFLIENFKKLTNSALLQDKKIQNMDKILQMTVSKADRKKPIAYTEDGTRLTIGDVLDAKDFIPEILN